MTTNQTQPMPTEPTVNIQPLTPPPSMNDMNPTDNQSSIDAFRPLQPGDRVRIKKVNGCFPIDRYSNIRINREVIGELGEKDGGNFYDVYIGPSFKHTVDLAYLEFVAPGGNREGHFFLHLEDGLSCSRYAIYCGSFREPTFVCSLSDKYYTKEKAEEEIARLRAQYQQSVKEN